MAQIRNMLRALFYDRRTPPSNVLRQLDATLEAGYDSRTATALLARIEPGEKEWNLHWCSTGHLPPLVIMPDGQADYLPGEPGVPLTVDPALLRLDHHIRLPAGATVVFFTDGLIEHPAHSIDEGMAVLIELASTHSALPVEDMPYRGPQRMPPAPEPDGHKFDRFGDVAVSRRGADAEPGGKLDIGVSHPQMGEGEQGLAADPQASPPEADRATLVPQLLCKETEDGAGHVDARRVDKHVKPLVDPVVLVETHLPGALPRCQPNCPTS